MDGCCLGNLEMCLNVLVGNTQHHVLNSSSFIQEIKDLRLDPNDVLISFDVVSLFTNVPVDETCNIIKQKLLDDISLHERTQLSADEIIDLLKLCLSNTCFQWRDGFYEQTSGAAMGSPLSPVLASIFMEHFEQIALELLVVGLLLARMLLARMLFARTTICQGNLLKMFHENICQDRRKR